MHIHRLGVGSLALCVVVVGASLGCATTNSVEHYKAEARAAEDEGRSVEALRALRNATQLAPEDAEVWAMLGAAAMRSDRHSEAEQAFARAVALQPGDPVLLTSHGVVLSRLERYAEAEDALLRSLVLRPKNPTTLAALGEVYRRSDQPEKCAARYAQFIWLLERGDPSDLSPREVNALKTARERVQACEIESGP